MLTPLITSEKKEVGFENEILRGQQKERTLLHPQRIKLPLKTNYSLILS